MITLTFGRPNLVEQSPTGLVIRQADLRSVIWILFAVAWLGALLAVGFVIVSNFLGKQIALLHPTVAASLAACFVAGIASAICLLVSSFGYRLRVDLQDRQYLIEGGPPWRRVHRRGSFEDLAWVCLRQETRHRSSSRAYLRLDGKWGLASRWSSGRLVLYLAWEDRIGVIYQLQASAIPPPHFTAAEQVFPAMRRELHRFAEIFQVPAIDETAGTAASTG